uniref:Uncharacterized protein n=1 Tax=Populus trichocarpa TaxID=3694 RepID=A0A2K1R7A3_POPTR
MGDDNVFLFKVELHFLIKTSPWVWLGSQIQRFAMPVLSEDLQYMVREPISPGAAIRLMHGIIKSDQSMKASWFSKKGVIYIDGPGFESFFASRLTQRTCERGV